LRTKGKNEKALKRKDHGEGKKPVNGAERQQEISVAGQRASGRAYRQELYEEKIKPGGRGGGEN